MFRHHDERDWMALATDGQRGPSAVRLREHLTRCDACRAEWAALADLLTQARAGRSVPPPAPLKPRVEAAMAMLREEEVFSRRAARRADWRPLAALGAFVVLLVVLALLVPGSPGLPLPALADVERAMRQVKTAHWVEIVTPYDPEGRPKHPRRTEFWARMNPPAVVAYALPDGSAHGDKRRPLSLFATTDPHPDTFLHLLILENTSAPDMHRSLLAADGPWERERVILAGVPMVRFHREAAGRISSVMDRESIWADPVTHRVLRREHRRLNRFTGRTEWVEILEGLRYDVLPPAGTFRTKGFIRRPPARMSGLAWMPVPRPKALSPRELAEMQRVIDASEDAWRRGDFAAFAAVWDFGVDNPERGPALRAQWKQRVERQQGRWSQWRSQIVPTSVQPQVRAGIDQNGTVKTSLLNSLRPEKFLVGVSTHGAWAGDGDTWQGKAATYTLRRTGETYRITAWADPTSAIRAEHLAQRR